jgi:hypothetical protein
MLSRWDPIGPGGFKFRRESMAPEAALSRERVPFHPLAPRGVYSLCTQMGEDQAMWPSF